MMYLHNIILSNTASYRCVMLYVYRHIVMIFSIWVDVQSRESIYC